MTKKFNTNERINDIELDCISGGTVEELYDLTKKIMDVNPGFLGTLGSGAVRVADFLQNGTKVGKITGPLNALLSSAVNKYLKNNGISADISIGFLGTDLGSDPNRYSYNGQRISHSKALTLIQPA